MYCYVLTNKLSILRQKLSRALTFAFFALFSVIFVKVSAFINSKSSKSETFSTQNHGYFCKKRNAFSNFSKLIRNHKNGEIFKSNDLFLL